MKSSKNGRSLMIRCMAILWLLLISTMPSQAKSFPVPEWKNMKVYREDIRYQFLSHRGVRRLYVMTVIQDSMPEFTAGNEFLERGDGIYQGCISAYREVVKKIWPKKKQDKRNPIVKYLKQKCLVWK